MTEDEEAVGPIAQSLHSLHRKVDCLMATVETITAKLQQIVDADLPGAVADIKAEVDALKAAAQNPAALAKLDSLVDWLGTAVKAADPGPLAPLPPAPVPQPTGGGVPGPPPPAGPPAGSPGGAAGTSGAPPAPAPPVL